MKHLALPLALSLAVLAGSPARGGQYTGGQPPLSIGEYKQWVNGLAGEVGGNPSLLADKLRAFGFTCAPPDAARLLCVRFGCEKRAGLFWRGALLQWTVNENRGKFESVALGYGWSKGCYPPERTEREQRRFVLQ